MAIDVELRGLVTKRKPPDKRSSKCADFEEHHLYEGAVMLAFAMHLLVSTDANEVSIHPDGEHGKQFDFQSWLISHQFSKQASLGTTDYGGEYRHVSGCRVIVNPKSGLGDVVAMANGKSIVAECKGGVINTKHSGQVSKLRRGLCETVGLLMSTPVRGRQFAVVPDTEVTRRLAERLLERCGSSGIEIALVNASGRVDVMG